VPYTEGEDEEVSTPVETMLKTIQNYYMILLIFGITVTIIAIWILRWIFGRNKDFESEEEGVQKR
jgi:hypothetical protein